MLALWLVACGIPEEDYSTRRGVAECQRIERCTTGEFLSVYDDFDHCVDRLGDNLDATIEALYQGCTYDGREASRCVSRISSMSCEDYAEGQANLACDIVYVCLSQETGA